MEGYRKGVCGSRFQLHWKLESITGIGALLLKIAAEIVSPILYENF